MGKIKSEAEARESHLGRASEEAEFFKREAARLEQQLNDASREVERLTAVQRGQHDRAGEKEGLILQLQAKDQELEHYKAEVARWVYRGDGCRRQGPGDDSSEVPSSHTSGWRHSSGRWRPRWRIWPDSYRSARHIGGRLRCGQIRGVESSPLIHHLLGLMGHHVASAPF